MCPQRLGAQRDDAALHSIGDGLTVYVEEEAEDVADGARAAQVAHLLDGEAAHLHHGAVVARVADADQGEIGTCGAVERLADVAVAEEGVAHVAAGGVGRGVEALAGPPKRSARRRQMSLGLIGWPTSGRAADGADEGAAARRDGAHLIGHGAGVAAHADGDDRALVEAAREEAGDHARKLRHAASPRRADR